MSVDQVGSNVGVALLSRKGQNYNSVRRSGWFQRRSLAQRFHPLEYPVSVDQVGSNVGVPVYVFAPIKDYLCPSIRLVPTSESAVALYKGYVQTKCPSIRLVPTSESPKRGLRCCDGGAVSVDQVGSNVGVE